jgi:hypothetical protein
MKRPANYTWQIPCRAVFRESHPSKMVVRFYEAASAIEQRLLSPVRPGTREEIALRGAQRAVELLRGQMTGYSSELGNR